MNEQDWALIKILNLDECTCEDYAFSLWYSSVDINKAFFSIPQQGRPPLPPLI